MVYQKEFKINKQKDVIESIKIEEDVWLGTHVTVTKVYQISKKVTVVSANSVVTKEFPSYSIIAGCSCKINKR
ncbi:MAG: hypothetical protein U5K55_01430 [Aliarcobacter sp.]|nr:hypothetical protein [Aliarcobacter sp.]